MQPHSKKVEQLLHANQIIAVIKTVIRIILQALTN